MKKVRIGFVAVVVLTVATLPFIVWAAPLVNDTYADGNSQNFLVAGPNILMNRHSRLVRSGWPAGIQQISRRCELNGNQAYCVCIRVQPILVSRPLAAFQNGCAKHKSRLL